MSSFTIYISPRSSVATGASAPVFIDAIIGGITQISPDDSIIVDGLIADNQNITSTVFTNAQVEVTLGGTTIPGIDPGNGDAFMTKDFSSDTIVLSNKLADGDVILIKVFGSV